MPKDIIFTDAEVVKAMGYRLDCHTPLEITHKDGSQVGFASGEAAKELIHKYRKRMLKVYKANMLDKGPTKLEKAFCRYTCATCKEAIGTNCDFMFDPKNIDRYCTVEGCEI